MASKHTQAAKASTKTTRTKKVASKKPTAPAITPPGPAATSADLADLVDQQLAKYRGMRDFGITAEPSGTGNAAAQQAAARTAPERAKAAGGLPFVIQKHAASHMHYDFRLGWNGVLKSWAVSKGPSYVVADRRLAVQVEDHPMEYGGFEGVIPHGQYGGGTVMVWDQGTWSPQPGHENIDAGLREGSLKFKMHGAKMRGKWTLIRMHSIKPRAETGAGSRWRSSDKPQWLLIKEHDAFEQPADAPAVTEAMPDSAVTGRSLEQIAHQEDHIWNSEETAGTGQAWYRQDFSADQKAPSDKKALIRSAKTPRTPVRARAEKANNLGEKSPAQAPTPIARQFAKPLAKLPKEPQPEFLDPQLALESEAPPEGKGWLHELKLDGYRMQARKSGRGVQMLTRSGLDWTYRVPAVAEAVTKLPVQAVTLDGEVVVVGPDGNTVFADLQASFQQGAKHPLTFFCFDLLHIEGRNPRDLPLRERKALLAQLLPVTATAVVRLSEHLEIGGGLMFQQACQLHAEGIVSKRADAPYRAGRLGDWLKSKCLHEQEFVIGGYMPSADGADRIGSLLLGYYATADAEKNKVGRLIYAGRTGTGFTQRTRRDLRTQLHPLESKTMPFARVPAEARRNVVWVRPALVAQVRFATWTAEDLLRQAAFLGLREDKCPEEVVREEATAPPRPKGSGHPRQSRPTPAPPRSGKLSGQADRADQAYQVDQAAQNTPRATPTSLHAPAPAQKAKAKSPTAPVPIRLTHPDKTLDPESGLTKRELAAFYWAVADRMLPHIADRPLSLVRCPDGAGKPCFYQKHVNHMLPPGIGSIDVPDKKTGVIEPYITLSTPEALAGLAQMGVLEIHPWGSCNQDLEHPDRLIFDLDPDEDLPWTTVAEAALDVRARLKRLGLESFLKTTGGKGLHVVAPILPRLDFNELKAAAHAFVVGMERQSPARYLTKMTKAARRGKIYLDYLRNERGATAVAPYSPRARLGVHASIPLDWKELATGTRPVFALRDFASWQPRLKRDPWKNIGTLRQELDPTRIRSL